MAFLRQPKTESEIKKLGVAAVRNSYNNLASDYNKIINYDYLFCHGCSGFMSSKTAFYVDKRFATGFFPLCKRCVQKLVEQRKDDKDESNETKESVLSVLRMLDLPFYEDLYEQCIKGADEGLKEKNRKSPFATYITCIKSLPQYKGETFANSQYDDGIDSEKQDINENSRILKQAKKRFGDGYSNSDLMFLENEYQDWIKRYACENKAQEILFKRICFKELEIDKAQKQGKDTKELDKTLQEIMGSLQVKPNQSNSNALTEAKTFGQLIQKWENEKPIPEPEDEFKDVDKVGLYIDVFFKGHLSKMMGLKNAFTSLYDRFMSKYTVTKPQYDEDADSEVLFDKIFGSKLEDD